MILKLKDVRKEKGMTQQDLAIRLGVKQATVAMWESGKSVPSLKNLLGVSRILEVSASDLAQSFDRDKNDDVIKEGND